MGTTEILQDQFVLGATALPLNQFGFFLTSKTPGLVALPGISTGNLCLAGSVGRLNRSFEIQNTGSLGFLTIPVPLGSLPQPQGSVPALVGETWYFQGWFRDIVGGASTSNFTDRVEVLFR